jgi:serine/threonine protein kinase
VNTHRWERLQEVFHEALKRPADERPAYLGAACADDPELRCEVEALLSHEGQADELLEGSAWKTDPALEGVQPAEPLTVGACIAQYRITGKLGEGGMGAVFRATDTRLHRDVALKVLPAAFASDREWMTRFQYEARVLAALNHPHIAAIYGLEESGEQRAIAMELVEGVTLAKRMESGPIPEAEALAIARQIAEALQYSHAHGIIHCDLKPANIMVNEQGQVKLLDFGIAQRFRRAEAEQAKPEMDGAMEGAFAGTAGYMSPEQIRGLPLDHRTDFFALGVLTYEMLTGNRPFAGETRLALTEAILHAPPREFGDRPVTGGAKRLVRKLLEKDPGDRPSSAAAILEELQPLTTERAPAYRTKHGWMGIGAAAVLVAVVAGWFGLAWSKERWAREVAMPEITTLLEVGEYLKAAALTEEARAALPADPILETAWRRVTGEVSIATEPAGAEVEARPYSGDRNAWKSVGTTPFEGIRMPRQPYVWRIRKPGFAELTFIGEPVGASVPGYIGRFKIKVKLVPADRVPPDMVAVPAGRTGLTHPMGTARIAEVASFLIDRHEVTNREYKRFVDAGGYRERRYWNPVFQRAGRTVAWEEAVAEFRDSTGKPGPATWSGGEFPKGQENYPVSGVSWYEAEAYTKFAGKQLPTAYQWTLASQSVRFTALITPGSNFRGDR